MPKEEFEIYTFTDNFFPTVYSPLEKEEVLQYIDRRYFSFNQRRIPLPKPVKKKEKEKNGVKGVYGKIGGQKHVGKNWC